MTIDAIGDPVNAAIRDHDVSDVRFNATDIASNVVVDEVFKA